MTAAKSLLTVRIETAEGPSNIDYDSIDSCLRDDGLRALFDAGHILSCSVHCGGKRITGLPAMEWRRLVEQVASNSPAIVRSLVGKGARCESE